MPYRVVPGPWYTNGDGSPSQHVHSVPRLRTRKSVDLLSFSFGKVPGFDNQLSRLYDDVKNSHFMGNPWSYQVALTQTLRQTRR